MRFLADMGVPMGVVTWLRGQGHDVGHLRDKVSEIAALTGRVMTSVVSFRLRNTRTDHVIARLAAVLAASSADLEAGAVVSVEDGRHRVRTLPIGSD